VNGLRQLLRAGGALRAVAGLSSATVVGQVLLAGVVPLLTRLYTPEAFGSFSAFSGMAMALLVASGLRYDLAIPLERRDHNARVLLFGTLMIGAIFACVSLPVVVILEVALDQFDGIAGIHGVVWLLPAFLLFAGANRSYTALAVRDRRFGDVARTRVLQAPATIIIQLVGGLAGLGAPALIIGFIVGQTAGLVSLMRGPGGPRALIGGGAIPWRRLRVLWRRHRRFPRLDMPAAFADTLAAHAPTILLTFLFSPATAGIYAVHQRLLLAPAGIVGQAVGQVLLGRVRDDKASGELTARARRIAGVIALIAAAIAVVGFMIVDPLLAAVIGTDFARDGTYARFVLLGVAGQFVYSPLSVLLGATNGQHVNLVVHVVLLAAKAAALWWGAARGCVLDAVIAVSVVNGVVYLLATVWVLVHVAAFERRNRC
jgi:O-antigen/teichoic acid export membrane protein